MRILWFRQSSKPKNLPLNTLSGAKKVEGDNLPKIVLFSNCHNLGFFHWVLVAGAAGVAILDLINSLTWNWRTDYHLVDGGNLTYYSTPGLIAISGLLGLMLLTGFLTHRPNSTQTLGGV